MTKDKCTVCDGTGRIFSQYEDGFRDTDCPTCKGTGLIDQLEAKDIGSTKPQVFCMTRDEAKGLKSFLFRNGYISYEFDEVVHKILRDLNRFLGD